MDTNGNCYPIPGKKITVTFMANTGSKTDAHFPDGSLSKKIEYTLTT